MILGTGLGVFSMVAETQMLIVRYCYWENHGKRSLTGNNSYSGLMILQNGK